MEHLSLRAVALEVGVSHRGLSRILDGSDLQARTKQKLDRWYREVNAPAEGEVSVAEALAALLAQIPVAQRRDAQVRIVEFLETLYRSHGVVVPSEISRLKVEE